MGNTWDLWDETNSELEHLKMDGWNTFSFPFGAFRPIFRGELLVLGSVVFQPSFFSGELLNFGGCIFQCSLPKPLWDLCPT